MTVEGYAEHGTIANVFRGEAHGIETISIGIDFEGSQQGFGGLALQTKALADDFAADLCATFGVGKLDDLRGKRCTALRCFPYNNEPIEGLEAPDGRRFILTAWRRRHYPDTLTPLNERSESIRGDIVRLKLQIAERTTLLARLAADYRSIHPVLVCEQWRRS